MPAPHVKLIWRHPEPQLGLVRVLPDGDIATTLGILSVKDGTLSGSPAKALTPSLPLPGKIVTPDQEVVIPGRPGCEVFWSTPKRKLAASRDLRFFVELDPRTSRILATTKAPDYIFSNTGLWGNPDSGLFLLTSMHEGMLDAVTDVLYLSRLKRSPLPFPTYLDFAHPAWGVLGIAMPKGVSMDAPPQDFLWPRTPLACGNPYTGKVYWRAEGYDQGLWLNPHLILAHRQGWNWRFLDGKTGRPISEPITEFGQAQHVQVAGPYVLLPAMDNTGQTKLYKVDS